MTPQIEGGPSRAGFPGARPPFLLGGKGGKCYSPSRSIPSAARGTPPITPLASGHCGRFLGLIRLATPTEQVVCPFGGSGLDEVTRGRRRVEPPATGFEKTYPYQGGKSA